MNTKINKKGGKAMEKIINKIMIITAILIMTLSIQTFAVSGEQIAQYAQNFLEYPYSKLFCFT